MFNFTLLLAQIEVGMYMLVENWRYDYNAQPIPGSRFFTVTARLLSHGGHCNCRFALDRCQCVHCTIEVPTIKFDWNPRMRKLFMLDTGFPMVQSQRVLNRRQAAQLTMLCARKVKGL